MASGPKSRAKRRISAPTILTGIKGKAWRRGLEPLERTRSRGEGRAVSVLHPEYFCLLRGKFLVGQDPLLLEFS
jgi:hypothetical protein